MAIRQQTWCAATWRKQFAESIPRRQTIETEPGSYAIGLVSHGGILPSGIATSQYGRTGCQGRPRIPEGGSPSRASLAPAGFVHFANLCAAERPVSSQLWTLAGEIVHAHQSGSRAVPFRHAPARKHAHGADECGYRHSGGGGHAENGVVQLLLRCKEKHAQGDDTDC